MKAALTTVAASPIKNVSKVPVLAFVEIKSAIPTRTAPTVQTALAPKNSNATRVFAKPTVLMVSVTKTKAVAPVLLIVPARKELFAKMTNVSVFAATAFVVTSKIVVLVPAIVDVTLALFA